MSTGHQQVTGNINSFNVLMSRTFTENDDEERQILQWLSPLEPLKRHQNVRTDRLDGVGNWVLETGEFRKWRDGCVEPVLFCYGDPGVGKTYLSSLVIDILRNQAAGRGVTVVGLYCDFLAQQEQSTACMLGAILKQLVSRGGISEHIREAFQKSEKEFGGRGLLLPDLVEILKKTISPIPRVFICIDALDESAPKHRRELLRSLREIIQVSPNTRIFLTGRRHVDNEIVCVLSEAVRIHLIPIQDDIKRCLKMRLDRDTTPEAMDDGLRADIMRIIPEKISEIFLLVSLSIDAILGETTLHQRREKLEEMTKGKGLGGAYAATLSRVKSQKGSRSKLGIDVLMWVSHSERPLHVDELCHALGVEEGSNDLNIQNIPTMETLLACSLGLVTVEKSSSAVRLVHYTLQEYLIHNSNLFHKPHSVIAEVCLTYLNFRHVRDLPPTLRSAPPTVPFVEYASCYWGAHARRETTESVKTLALKLLDEYDRHISSKMLLLHGMGSEDQPFDAEDSPKGFTGLHGVAYLGCVEITVALLEMKEWDAQATDFNGNTAITWAARMGHEEIVRMLLEWSGVDPNTADTKYGRTPLYPWQPTRHEGIMRMLPKHSYVEGIDRIRYEEVAKKRTSPEWNDVDPNTIDDHDRKGKKKKRRQGPPVDDEPPPRGSYDEDFRCPYWVRDRGNCRRSCFSPKKNLSKLKEHIRRTHFLHLGCPFENCRFRAGDNFQIKRHQKIAHVGQTEREPVPWTASSERKNKALGIRNLTWDQIYDICFREEPGDPNGAPGGGGEEEEEEDISDEKDDEGVNSSIVNTKHGRTPLLWTAEEEHEGVVRMLLGRNDVNPDPAEHLSWAAENGCGRIVELQRERTDPIQRYARSLQSTEPFSVAPSGLSELFIAPSELSEPFSFARPGLSESFSFARSGLSEPSSIARFEPSEPFFFAPSGLSEPPPQSPRGSDIQDSCYASPCTGGCR